MFLKGCRVFIMVAASLISIGAAADNNQDINKKTRLDSPVEAWNNLIYITPAANRETMVFSLPEGVSESDIAQVTFAGNFSGKSQWHVDGDKILFSPFEKWSMGMNLIELKLKDDQVFDFFVVIYGGKFELKEKTAEYHRRMNQAAEFKKSISAEYTDNATAAVTLRKNEFAGKQLEWVRINGETVDNVVLESNVFSYSPQLTWHKGLNRIEIQFTDDEQPYIHLLNYHPKVTKVNYSIAVSSVDGLPFFPRAIYYVKPASFAKVANFGFNVVHDYQLRTLPEEEVSSYLQEADSNGLMVFLHINKPALESGDVLAFAERITRQMAEPALFAWYFWDEPSPNEIPAEYYTFFTDLVRQLDPYHPIISSHWYQRYYADAGEIDMRQLYHGKVDRMAKDLALYKRVMAQTNTPWLAIVNTHEGFKPKDNISISPRRNTAEFVNKATSPEQKKRLQEWLQARNKVISANLENPPFPIPSTLPQTRHQIRGQAFEAIVQGSNGIFYWPYREPNDLDPVNGWYTLFHLPKPASYLRELLTDLKTLEPLITVPGQDSISWVENGVRLWQRQKGDNTIVIAVNESGEQLSTTVQLKPFGAQDWPEKLVRFGHLSESHIALEEGRISDSWKPNQAHVYLLNSLSN